MQTDQMKSEETVAGRSYRQKPTKMNIQTIRQSITLARKTITSKAIDNKIRGQQQQNDQRPSNEYQHEQETKLQDNGDTKLRETGSHYTNNPEQELRNPNFSQSKSQSPLITTFPELGQVKGKVEEPNQKMQPTNDHDTRSRTGQLKSVHNKSLGSPEARANSDTPSRIIPQQEQRKKAYVAPVTEDKSAKHSKGSKTSAGSKKQKQRSNSENQIEIEHDTETDQLDLLN
ncbi:MAG: hypothetical protein EZS28_011436 [Streblomastix strix]|uniref:Uncharacterized protein n=1 Tax=Streblomastix strix TaxID=222440 RepID=A0A5J4WDS1_9EUKA|nr:MAG: hypothetical protein EZS28_011436 [Streblomastix strix]